LRLAADDVGDRAIVGDESARRIGAGGDGVEVDVRLLRASYEPLPPMRTFTKSKPGNDTGFSSAGYIVVAPPMFTSSLSDGVSPTVSML
jgi:hypothetical protein